MPARDPAAVQRFLDSLPKDAGAPFFLKVAGSEWTLQRGPVPNRRALEWVQDLAKRTGGEPARVCGGTLRRDGLSFWATVEDGLGATLDDLETALVAAQGDLGGPVVLNPPERAVVNHEYQQYLGGDDEDEPEDSDSLYAKELVSGPPSTTSGYGYSPDLVSSSDELDPTSPPPKLDPQAVVPLPPHPVRTLAPQGTPTVTDPGRTLLETALEELSGSPDTKGPEAMARSPLARDRYHAAKSGLLGPVLLRPLTEDPDASVRGAAIAASPEPDQLQLLARESNPYAREEVARETRFASVQALCCGDRDAHVRQLALLNYACTAPDFDAMYRALSKLDAAAICETLAVPECPGKLLELAAKHADEAVQVVVAGHANTPVAARKMLLAGVSVDSELGRAGLLAPGVKLEDHFSNLVEFLKDAETDSTKRKALETCAWPKEKQWTAKVLRETCSQHNLLQLLRNPNFPSAVAQELCHHPDSLVVEMALQVPEVVAPFEALARSPEASVRATVASHPMAGATLLAKLAQDKSALVRACVAGHIDTPVSALQALASDPDEQVRHNVASHGNADTACLETLLKGADDALSELLAIRVDLADKAAKAFEVLATHRSARVRALVATAPGLPARLLTALRSDPDPTVVFAATGGDVSKVGIDLLLKARDLELRRRAITHPDCTPKHVLALAQSPEAEFRGLLLESIPLPPEVLLWFSDDPSVEVRCALASVRGLPRAVLERLAADPSQVVRAILATSPYTPIWALWLLADDSSEEVKRALQESRTATPELIARVRGDDAKLDPGTLKPKDLPLERCRSLARHPKVGVRLVVTRSPDVDGEVALLLARDPAKEVRAAIAERRGFLEPVAKQLMSDPELSVRQALLRASKVPRVALERLAEDKDRGVSEAAKRLLEDR